MAGVSDLRERLRALPSFPDDLPEFDADAVPTHPLDLFADWLDDAIAAGERQPHALTLTTVGHGGLPASRTLIVKDIDEHGIQFASSRSSRKAEQLAAHPIATVLCFWRELGRQVEVTGEVVDLGADASQADWRERPSYDGRPNPDWVLWALQPARFEFLQATHDRRHMRVEYLLAADGWTHRRPTAAVG